MIEILVRGLYFAIAASIIIRILRSMRFPREKTFQTILALCIALAGAVALPFLFVLIAFAIFSLPLIIYGLQRIRYGVRPPKSVKSEPKSAGTWWKAKTPDQEDTQMYSTPTPSQALSITLPSGQIRCGSCGIENSSKAKFCRICGKPLRS